jgi:hypothetical protein
MSTLEGDRVAAFLGGAHHRERVEGLTHGFYRYPARFSPLFARGAIELFTHAGDLVLDPFMGGGTALVEARALGRVAIGVDINSLAVFVSRVKTTPLSEQDLSTVQSWAATLPASLNLRNPAKRVHPWISTGYQRNISDRKTWPIRKTLELALGQLDKLGSVRGRRFARCALLKTGQWALDCRREIPSARQFRDRILVNISDMSEGAREYARVVGGRDHVSPHARGPRVLCLRRSAAGMEADSRLAPYASPKLILTSPPYPGVHVLYHRWQVQGRRETPAPFWIAGCVDGHGASYYTFGHREQQSLSSYYEQMHQAFASLARISDGETVLVQMVGFSEPEWQLPRYLDVLGQCGFVEIKMPRLQHSADGRLWRRVPNRKWYTEVAGALPSSREVVLLHRLG